MTHLPHSAWSLLVRRFARTRGMKRSAALLAATFLVLAAVPVTVASLDLSQGQQAEATFGSFGQSTYTVVGAGELEPGFMSGAAAALDAALPSASLHLQTDQLRPDSYARTYVQAPINTVQFWEGAELRGTFPGRFALREGAWPASASEVVVSRKIAMALPDPEQFTVLSSRATLRVVGVVEDAFSKKGDVIVAAPGTWESIRPGLPGRQFQPVEAQLRVLFDESGTAADVTRALDPLLPPLPAERGTHAESWQANAQTRPDPTAENTAPDDPGLIVSYVPLALAVLLVSALVVGQNRHEQLAAADRLVAIGLRRGKVRAAQAVAVAVASAIAIAAGLASGLLLAIALRATVLPAVANQPLSPLTGLGIPHAATAALALLLVAAGALWPARGKPAAKSSTAASAVADLPVAMLRRFAVVLLAITALSVDLSVARRGHVIAASYLALTSVVLLAPDLLLAAIRTLSVGRARPFVLRRLMGADFGRQAAATTVVSVCLALPLCAATQLASQEQTAAAAAYSRVPANQIWVANAAGPGSGDADGAARTVARVAGVGPVIEIRDLALPPDEQGISQRVGRFGRLAADGGTAVLVVDDVRQLERLLSRKLGDDAERLLDGAVLDFTGTPGSQRVVLFGAGGAPTEEATPDLPTVKMSVDRALSSRFSGAMLTSTAQNLGLPVSAPNAFVYTGTAPATIAAAVDAVVGAGYDTEFAQYNVPPPPPNLPTSAYVFLAGLSFGGFGVLLLVVRGQASRLRSYSARLAALGLRPGWTLGLLLTQCFIIVGVGLGVGAVAGIAGVLVLSITYPVLSVPLLPVALAIGLSASTAAVAVVLAARTLNAERRLGAIAASG